MNFEMYEQSSFVNFDYTFMAKLHYCFYPVFLWLIDIRRLPVVFSFFFLFKFELSKFIT